MNDRAPERPGRGTGGRRPEPDGPARTARTGSDDPPDRERARRSGGGPADRAAGTGRKRPGTGAGRPPSTPAGRAAAEPAGSGRDRAASGRAAGGAGRDGADDGRPERIRPGDPGRWPVGERSLLPNVLGVSPLAAVGVAAALTALGVCVDLLRVGTLGAIFTVCYLTGCVLGAAWVRREGLFWPMVLPPLLMAVAVPVVVLLAGEPAPGAGVAQRLLIIGAPLVNGFPMMAWTTGLTLALGVFRLLTQRVRRAPGAARGAARTSASPRRS